MASGNDSTCTVSGALVTVTGMAPCIACCYLNLYFLMTTKYSWNERDVQRHLEIPAYAFGGFVVVAFVVAFLSLNLMKPNPVAQLCSPLGEDKATEGLLWSYTLVAILFAGTGIWATYRVYKHVQSVINASRAHDAYSIATGISRDPRQKRVERVAKRAVMYTASLMNTLLWPTMYNLLSVYTNVGQEGHQWWWYTMILIGFTLFPLQGFFNFFIYIQTRASAWKKYNPELTVVEAVWWAVAKPMDPPSAPSMLESSSHSGRRTTVPSTYWTLSTSFHISHFLSLLTVNSNRPSPDDALPTPGGPGPIALERRESGMVVSGLSSDVSDYDNEFAGDSFELPLHERIEDIEADSHCLQSCPSPYGLDTENQGNALQALEGTNREVVPSIAKATSDLQTDEKTDTKSDKEVAKSSDTEDMTLRSLDSLDHLEDGIEDIELAKAA